MITIKKTSLSAIREPLAAPFGFKGGYVDELWQSVVCLADEIGNRATGLGVQSVLWSDPDVHARWGHERGNAFMQSITAHALEAAEGATFETPLDLLDGLLGQARAYGDRAWVASPLRATFALNALVPVDHAAWALLAQRHPDASFYELIPEVYRSALTARHDRLACTPVVSYGMTAADVEALLDEGYFVLKIKLGSDPDGDGDPDKMLAWDIRRLEEIHRIADRRDCPHTESGRIVYYLDINGRYGGLEPLRRLIEAAERMGALDCILVVEEPFLEHVHASVADVPVRVAGDESVHDEGDAIARIQMGYGAFALKPVAKTMSMSLRIARTAAAYGIPCFCADLTASPVMVDWNKNLAARLAPLPGLSMGLIESNGGQNYRDWGAMKRRHPRPEGAWIEAASGMFRLDAEFYARSGGALDRSAYYDLQCNLK
ncbi:L-alanine-DL-glutamate epimerase [Cohnella sp. OV330]|uniref:enolase C-terminal domain-like protein n=1 Tax=Cohnella sp. OV330 TaxID=1855288 RepID=UPI0008F334AD|nr:enolase C-terminal domain-like protein [Cohnella sp. OV330]SFA73255.1 L-alanine-DL-glutamate epimerase [Cohnella sp. OV330]